MEKSSFLKMDMILEKYTDKYVDLENVQTILKDAKTYQELKELRAKHYDIYHKLENGKIVVDGVEVDADTKLSELEQLKLMYKEELAVEVIDPILEFAEKYSLAPLREIEVIKEQMEYEKEEAAKGLLGKNERIPMVPKVKATFGADYQFTDKLEMGTTVTYVGSYNVLEPGRGYDLVISKVPHHLLTDVYGTYKFTPNTSVKFGVNNVFNHEYNLRQDFSSGTPAPGRTYSLGFTHRF